MKTTIIIDNNKAEGGVSNLIFKEIRKLGFDPFKFNKGFLNQAFLTYGIKETDLIIQEEYNGYMEYIKIKYLIFGAKCDFVNYSSKFDILLTNKKDKLLIKIINLY